MSHAAGIEWECHHSLLSRHFLWVKGFAAFYVLGIPLSHYALPHSHIWGIALFFLIAMLFTYPVSAIIQRAHIRLEFAISLGLAVLGILGWILSPWLIILAIAAHGTWDLLKHRHSAGVSFFGWYVSGCAVVDFCYAGALCAVLMQGGTI